MGILWNYIYISMDFRQNIFIELTMRRLAEFRGQQWRVIKCRGRIYLEAKIFFDLLEVSKKPIFKRYELSLLSVVSLLINIKCEFNILNRLVDNMLALIKEMCPPNNGMTNTYYFAMKLLAIAALQLPHERIDVCCSGCMLYLKDKIDLDRCEHCSVARYERKTLRDKGVVKKVLIYYPIGVINLDFTRTQALMSQV